MSSYNETSRLPQDEDERIIEEVRRRKADKKKAIGYEEPYERAQSEGYGGGGSRSSQKYEYESPRGRRKDKSPIAMRYRSRSPSPVSRNLRGRSRSPPPRATAPIEVMHEREGEYRYDEFSGRRHFDVGYQVALPTGGPIAESPSISSVSSSPSTESMSPSPTMPKESTRHRLMHPLEPKHKKLSKKHPLGTRTVDLDTRVARVGKHGENVHFISFGKLQVRLIRGKHLPKNGIMSVHFYLPTPSVKAHAHPFGVSREVKRVENYTWDETFTTKVELETKENALEITRNLVVHLRYASPHLHRNLGDMEGTVDVSEMIRSSSPLHAAQVKLPLYPSGEHRKKRERAVDDKYRPKLYLEVLWRPSDAFRHSFASLEEDHRHDMKGIKTKNWRLNVAGFAPYGTSYGLIWLQNVAQSWIGSMGDVIDVLNVTSSVQPGPFSARGRSDVWEAVVTVWYRIDESKLRAHAKCEIEVLENRERELEERTMRRKHGTQQPLPVSGSGGRTQVPTRVSGSQQSQRGSGSYGSEQLQGGSSGQAGSVGDRSLGRPGQQQQPGQQQSRRDEDIEYSADQPSGSGNRW